MFVARVTVAFMKSLLLLMLIAYVSPISAQLSPNQTLIALTLGAMVCLEWKYE